MQEDVLIAATIETDIESNGDTYMEPDAAGVVTATADRLPEFSSWIPCGSVWLYAIPVILLLFLWLFYPVILILIVIILVLWLMN